MSDDEGPLPRELPPTTAELIAFQPRGSRAPLTPETLEQAEASRRAAFESAVWSEMLALKSLIGELLAMEIERVPNADHASRHAQLRIRARSILMAAQVGDTSFARGADLRAAAAGYLNEIFASIGV